MNIMKAQKVIRKAVKDYSIESALDEDTLVNVLSVELWKEESAGDSVPVRSVSKAGASKIAKLAEMGEKHGEET